RLGFDVADEHEEDSTKDKESDFRKDTVLDDVVKDKESDVVKDNVQDVVVVKDNVPDLLLDVVKKKRRRTEIPKFLIYEN
ncbi:hypothetical protein Tco_1021672, partial [Tanacetum coccineum]